MTINSYKVGPGTFALVATDFSAQLTQLQVVPSENVESTDVVKVLSGEQLDAEDTATYSYAVTGTFLQDLAAAGIIDYSWQNAGDTVAFTYQPVDATARAVEGFVRIVPLTIGGEVAVRATADFTWQCVGTPTFGVA